MLRAEGGAGQSIVVSSKALHVGHFVFAHRKKTISDMQYGVLRLSTPLYLFTTPTLCI